MNELFYSVFFLLFVVSFHFTRLSGFFTPAVFYLSQIKQNFRHSFIHMFAPLSNEMGWMGGKEAGWMNEMEINRVYRFQKEIACNKLKLPVRLFYWLPFNLRWSWESNASSTSDFPCCSARTFSHMVCLLRYRVHGKCIYCKLNTPLDLTRLSNYRKYIAC